MKKEDEKWSYYSVIISRCLSQLFDKESEYYIDITKDIDFTQFIYALSVSVPANIYNKLTRNNVNHLEFNHISNQLTFQYSKLSDEI